MVLPVELARDLSPPALPSGSESVRAAVDSRNHPTDAAIPVLTRPKQVEPDDRYQLFFAATASRPFSQGELADGRSNVTTVQPALTNILWMLVETLLSFHWIV